MARVRWMVGTFLMMYGIGTVVGFASYRLLSPFAMWVCVFTLMPVVSAFLIYAYLQRMRVGRASSLRESLGVTAVWMVLSFGLDAVTYIVVVPAATHGPPNWTFFHDQSPWIWLSYLILLLSALAAHRAHVTHHRA